MADADRILADYRRAFARIGETVAVRRYSDENTYSDIDALARVTDYDPRELIGSIVQGGRKVICLVDTLSSILPLTVADKIVVRGKELAIKGIDDNSRRVAGTLIALEIQIAG
jgi:hypothetical protein